MTALACIATIYHNTTPHSPHQQLQVPNIATVVFGDRKQAPLLVHNHSQTEVDGHQLEWTTLLDEVLGAEFTELCILVELPCVQVEQHIAESVLDHIEPVHTSRVTGHRQ